MHYLAPLSVGPRVAVSTRPIVLTGVYNGTGGLVASGCESVGCLSLYDPGQSTTDKLASEDPRDVLEVDNGADGCELQGRTPHEGDLIYAEIIG